MFLRGRPVTMYMPKDQVESYNLEAKAELPAKRLKLEWVYPFYNDCMLNWKLLLSGTLFLKCMFEGCEVKRASRFLGSIIISSIKQSNEY